MQDCVTSPVADAVASPVLTSGGGSPPAGATLAFAAAGSEQLFDGSGSYEFEGQHLGTGTPTYTMDAGTLLLGHDGVYVEGELNGVPAYGARAVGNIIPNSEDFTSYSEQNANGTLSDGNVFSINTANAYYFLRPGVAVTFPAGTYIRVQAKIRGGTIGACGLTIWGDTLTSQAIDTSAPAIYTHEVQLTASQELRFGFSNTAAHGAPTGNTGTIEVDWFMVEVGSASITPGEYVQRLESVGGYDGKAKYAYYSNANGNTVSSGLVTLAPGTPLTEQPSLLSQPALTNLCTYSNDMSNAAWTKVGAATATFNQVGLTGAPNTASLLTDNDTVLRNITQNNITVTDNTNSVTARFFVKKDGADTAEKRYQNRLDGGTAITQILNFRIDTGAINSTSFSDTEIRDAGDWWEVLAETAKPGNGSTSYDYKLLPRTSTGASGSMIIANAGLYDNKTIAEVAGSSPIITEGSTVTRGAVTIKFDGANHSDSASAYFCEYLPFGYVSGVGNGLSPLTRGNLGRIFYANFSSVIRSYDGTNINNGPSGVVDWANPTWADLGLAYGGSDLRVTANSSNGTEGSYDGGFAGTDLLANRDEAGGVPSSAAIIRNIRRYDAADYDEAKTKIDEMMS